MHRVVIVGGGFGGLHAAIRLKKTPLRVTLIDRRNHHLFQPLLYQVATGGLSPANIAAPLRAILRYQKNAEVILGNVVSIDPGQRHVVLADDSIVNYDTLIVAAGSKHSYFGRDDWSAMAPGLKSIDDATSIRRKILIAFEEAERESDPQRITRLLTFVIVGGGPTGVELAGAIAEIARQTMRHEFRHIDPASARVLLLEGSDRVLQSYPPDLSADAQRGLERIGVEVHTSARVTNVDELGVTLLQNGETSQIYAASVFWAAGVQASSLGRILSEATGAALDRVGRITVEADFSIAGHPNLFVIGDMALYTHTADGRPLPALAPVAMQAGKYVADVVKAQEGNRAWRRKFKYVDYGTMATIGRRLAVADLRGWHLRGALAWYAWLFIHIIQLVTFESRVLVLIQWIYHYFTYNRSVRLITGEDVERVMQHQATADAKEVAQMASAR